MSECRNHGRLSPMIELRFWRAFIVLAEELHFRRAANRLAITQPALTKQIRELETRLGVRLFERGARRVALTPAGASSLADACRLVTDAETLETTVRSNGTLDPTTVMVGNVEYITKRFLPESLDRLAKRCPEAKVVVSDLTPAESVAAIADGRLDLGFVVMPIDEPEFVTRTILSGEWCLAVPSRHRTAQLDSVPLTELDGERIILFARRGNPELYDHLLQVFHQAGIKPIVSYHTRDPLIGAQLADKGMGLFVVASYSVPHDLPQTLRIKRLAGFDNRVSVGAAWRPDRMRPALRMLIECLPMAAVARSPPNSERLAHKRRRRGRTSARGS